MTLAQLLTSTWNPDPSVLLGCLALLAAYAHVARLRSARGALFVSGLLLLLIALVSPLDTLGDRYLFSAHMLQHLLLVLAVPPLLLLGLPSRIFERLLHWAPARRAERILGRPAPAWLIGTGTLWVWHLPRFYDAALAHEGIHIVQHLTFLVAATIFWWPVVAPAPLRRLGSLGAVPYLLASSLASSVLGIILTFAPAGFYPAYVHPIDPLGIMRFVRHEWDLTAQADQQLGGLLMWTLSSPVYLAALIAAVARWYSEPEPETADTSGDLDTAAGEPGESAVDLSAVVAGEPAARVAPPLALPDAPEIS